MFMRFFYKNRGSVSIALSILILPMLVFSGLMIDSSNIYLSKYLTEGSAELAMNAVLANYDSVLKERYGLFATSQKEENYVNKGKQIAENHFKRSLEGIGVNQPIAIMVLIN